MSNTSTEDADKPHFFEQDPQSRISGRCVCGRIRDCSMHEFKGRDLSTATKSSDVAYRDHLQVVADEDVREIIRKDMEYGASWKKRGGTGAFFSMIRKVDRLNAQMPHPTHQYDIFAALMTLDVGSESLADTCADLRRYLMLIEAECRARRADSAKQGPFESPAALKIGAILGAVERNNGEPMPGVVFKSGQVHNTQCPFITTIGGRCTCNETHGG